VQLHFEVTGIIAILVDYEGLRGLLGQLLISSAIRDREAMPKLHVLPFVAGLFSVQKHPANAFPTGAGHCPGGRAAVEGLHIDPRASVTTGTLEEGGIQISINGQILQPGAEFVFESGVEQGWTLSTVTRSEFKGFLLRLSGGENEVDTTVALSSASPLVQEAYAGTFFCVKQLVVLVSIRNRIVLSSHLCFID
jgi:hypothetical protein